MRIIASLYLCIGLLTAYSAQAQSIRITPLTGADFGTVAVGSSKTLIFDLDSATFGDSLRSLVQASTPGDMWGLSPAPGFTLNSGNCAPGGGNPGGTPLASGTGCRFSVTFAPTAIGPATPYVIATTHVFGHWATLPLTAAGGLGQTIAFTSTPSPAAFAGGPGYSLASTATSGLPATYSVDPASSAVCFLIGGGYVELTAPGTCIVYANQAGDATYAPAAQVQQSFAVAAAPVVTPASPASIPTLSEWSLLVLSSLVGVFALTRMRRRSV